MKAVYKHSSDIKGAFIDILIFKEFNMNDQKAEKYLSGIISELNRTSLWNQYKAEHPNTDLTKTDFSGKDLKEFNFTDLTLVAANLFNSDLTGADLSRANLSYANMQRVNLSNAFLSNANLKVADLRGANAVDTNFDLADLTHAKLNGAWLVGSSFAGANLTGADMRGANLKFTNMADAILKGANVEETDLSNVELTPKQIQSLKYYDRAIIRGETPAASAKARKPKMKVDDSHDDLFSERDCFKILEITKDATLEEIEHAYRKKVMEYHPDRVHNLGEKIRIVAQREFERIQHAYKSLTQHKVKPAMAVDTAGDSKLVLKKTHGLKIDDYIELISKNPYDDKLHYNLGLLYFQKGFVELAIGEYEKALKINPYNTYATHNLRVAKLLITLSGEK